jgi:hypothetical protein
LIESTSLIVSVHFQNGRINIETGKQINMPFAMDNEETFRRIEKMGGTNSAFLEKETSCCIKKMGKDYGRVQAPPVAQI